MVFKAEHSVPIPNKDILSWTFDDLPYDVDKPIYVDAKDPSRSISAKQARVIIRKLVAGLRAAGLKKGDCVCISSFNDIMYPMLVLGTIAFGGVFTGTNPGYTQYELVHHLKASRAKFIISEPETLPTNLAAAKECGIPTSNILIFNILKQEIPAGFKSWESLMQHGEQDWVRFDDEKTSKNTTAARLFSSGTTGLPKAAILSHYNLIAEHTLVFEVRRKPWEQRRLICLPMFHAACVPMAHTSALRDGSVSYVMRRFELESYLSNIQKHSITDLLMVPPMIIAIVMSPVTKNYSFQSIKLALCGAAPLGKETQARFQLLFPKNAYCTQVWGMTEVSCIGSMFDYDEDDRTGSVGRFLPNMDVKLIDDNGQDITAYDTPGELCIRGPTVISAYFENPTVNTSSFDSDGFFKTGDIVYCSSSTKKWYVIDRKKELIKVRGFQVAPPEIETVLLSHPHIIDAAVIGITRPGDEEVELPRAYVVRRPGSEGNDLDEEKVKEWCRGKLAKYKELTGGVIFLDTIPKNASGKILKRVLREMAKEEIAKARL